MDRDRLGGIIVEAVHEVFETLVYVLPEESPAEQVATSVLEGELISSVHVSGDVRGVIAMICSRKTGENLALNMLGMSEGALGGEEVSDSVGEIVNMVAGHIKSHFVDNGLDFKISIPSVAAAGNLALRFPETLDATKVDFSLDGDPISVLFLVEDQKPGRPSA